MTNFSDKSLERYVVRTLSLFNLTILGLTGSLLDQYHWSAWNIAIILGVFLALLIVLSNRFYRRTMAAFHRGLWHVEAVRSEDYNEYSKAAFSHGCVADFHQQLKQLSEELSGKKSRYDQHAFLVYQLIDQLSTPILVFNQKNKLSYANGAFSRLYEQPWQMFRHASPKLLGLVLHNNKWQLSNKEHQWQVSQSEFIDDGETHQLLVFTNIELALRASQQSAWQQIIRVMGHEIRNSLTPVSSLAESLSTRSNNPRDQQALALISERCHHLQDFVSRYSSLSLPYHLNAQRVDVDKLSRRLAGLYQPHLSIKVSMEFIWADITFLEQVLINLIKNSIEANASDVALKFKQTSQKSIIELIDNGQGFANLGNLFVPLFTTKTQGQGIGLSFCRNIIELHDGSIDLKNNSDAGVTVTIILPRRV
ncbi:MAG: HAMP domain-containing histidine kinase [Psychrobium sp.]|nr:HAMP domain-containing histidine kinase [Psychrobium sp.]